MDPIVSLFNSEVHYESVVRSMTDDFSVVDLVNECDNMYTTED